MTTNTPKVWLITGCSSGLGQQVAQLALARGDVVIATARDPSKLSALASQGAFTTHIDVTASEAELEAAIQHITNEIPETHGRIDILVNNAGYILTGGIEEASREEAQALFNTNVFGQLNMIRAVLPVMRAQRSGVVANLGSLGGYMGGAGVGLYCASKSCATLIAETLRAEVAHLGIKVTAIEPGYTRTNFLVPGHRIRAARHIDDVEKGAVGETLGSYDAYSLKQSGDPIKAAQLIVDALTSSGQAEGRELPGRLVVGKDAYEQINGLWEQLANDMSKWADLATATNVDE